MSRSLKKGPYLNHKLIEKVKNMRSGDTKVIRVWDRGAVIAPEMVGFKFGIHNGKNHVEVLIVEDMVGHKLGEFAPTRKFIRHGGRIARDEAQAAAQKDAQAKTAASESEKKPASKEK